MAISQQRCLKLYRNVSLCLLTISRGLILRMGSNRFSHGPFLVTRCLNRLSQSKLSLPLNLPATDITPGNISYRTGGAVKKFSTAEFLSDFVDPDGLQVEHGECYHYVDHTDDIGLSAYSKDTYVFAHIPLQTLLTQITVSQARVVMKKHNISCGATESLNAIKSRLELHSCLCCMRNKSVFIKRLTKPKLPTERWQKHAQNSKIKSNATSGPELDPFVEFPPLPLNKNLSRHIIKQACSRMNAQNIAETGCAVCGELKPLSGMSRLKAVKRQLDILAASGVSRIQCRNSSSPLREYKGPILDYNCSMICNPCRASIRNGKIPKLALANGLWIGDVPPQLKCLNFVERLLVARIRHTCAYVKVASGMRKMTANVIAFQSPTPKVYNILPPPRDDLDDVLAILYTGPCKPTCDDLSRLPFFVR